MARPAARVPPPRMHLTRYHGGAPHEPTCAQPLKRVFGIDLETCTGCGGTLRVITSIEEPEVIARMLAHLEKAAPDQLQPGKWLQAGSACMQFTCPTEGEGTQAGWVVGAGGLNCLSVIVEPVERLVGGRCGPDRRLARSAETAKRPAKTLIRGIEP